MRKPALAILAFAFATAFVPPLFAQSGEIDPRFSAKLEPRPAGGVQYTITNLSDTPITAVVIEALYPDRSGMGILRSFDSVLRSGGARSPIFPQMTYSFQYAGGKTSNGTPISVPTDIKLRAIVFADGSSFGDSTDAVIQSREFTWDDVNGALSFLRIAKAGSVPIDEIIQELNDKQHAVEQARRSPQGRSFISARYYATLALNLAPPKNLAPDSTWTLSSGIQIESDELEYLRQQIFYSKPTIPGVLSADPKTAPPPPTEFVIHFSQDMDPAQTHVSYQLLKSQETSSRIHIGDDVQSSSFVGFVGHDYRIPTDFAGQPARGLSAVIYSPGCRLVTINIPSLAESSRTTDVHCERSAMVDLVGRISPSNLLTCPGCDYEVEVEFRVFFPGPSSDFQVPYVFPFTKITPDSNGIFHAQVPDLTGGVVVGASNNPPSVMFDFLAYYKQGNSLPDDHQRAPFAYLDTANGGHIAPLEAVVPRSHYDDEINFTLHPISHD
jgi:hypothetical protein